MNNLVKFFKNSQITLTNFKTIRADLGSAGFLLLITEYKRSGLNKNRNTHGTQTRAVCRKHSVNFGLVELSNNEAS